MLEPEPTPDSDLQPVATPSLAVSDNSLTALTSPTVESFNALVPDAPVRQRVAATRPGMLEVDNEFTKAVQEIQARSGAGGAILASKVPSFNQITTGVFTLDYALMGGVHLGVATQIYGWENVGKTSALLRIMASHQQRFPDLSLVFVPLEGTFDPEHALIYGVDLDRVLVLQPSSSENAIDEMVRLYKARETGAIFLDSVPALVPRAIIEKATEDKTMSEAARLATVLYQKFYEAMWNERRRGHYVSFFATNQWRMNPGKMFGDPRYLPGGNFQNFYYTNFIEIKSKVGKEQQGADSTGQTVLSQLEQGFHIKKAKVGACIVDGDFKTIISPDHPSKLPMGAVDDAAVVATLAKKHGFIKGGGQAGWRVVSSTGAEHKCRILDDIQTWLYSDPHEFAALKQRVIADLRVTRGRPAFPPDGYLLNRKKLFV